jgi:anti-anti-sigma factor
MPELAYPVQWTGQYAVMTLPQDIDGFNADQIREQLLWLIDCGAAVLVADLTWTVFCDHCGADALARAHVRAVENGAELRLVIASSSVRRVLASSGLDRIVPVYVDLAAADPALARRREARSEQQPGTADRAALAAELLDSVVSGMFSVCLALEGVTDSPDRVAVQRVTEALVRLDDVVRRVLAERGQGTKADMARVPPPSVLERSVRAMNRAALLQQQVVQTAHALQGAATDTVALLEQRADLVGLPSRLDYPADIKRFRALADQAREIAESWDQQS